MPTIDKFDQRAFRNEQKRHRETVVELTARIAEASGYLKRDVGNGMLTSPYARDILRDILEVVGRQTALESLNQLAFIVDGKAEDNANQ